MKPAREIWKLPRGVFFVPRLAIIAGGGGTIKTDSHASISTNPTPVDHSGSAKTVDASQFAVGAEGLVAVVPNFRFGLGVMYTPTTKVDSKPMDLELGSDLTGVGILEGAVAVAPWLALTFRGQGGVAVLFPGGDFKDDHNEAQKQIDNANASGQTVTNWAVNKGPYAGWTAGGGAGVLIKASDKVRPRLDFLYQHLAFSDYTLDATVVTNSAGDTQTINIKKNFSGNRVVILAGIEFF